jgi:hypothetical protein
MVTVMEPLTPNDPLWNLLGKARQARPRPNFVQNVVRAARQTPQERGWLSGLKAWWQAHELAHTGLAWAAAAVIALAGIWLTLQPRTESAPLAAQSVSKEEELTSADFLVPDFEREWQNLSQMGDLLVVNDTSVLTDLEIQWLLY